MKAKKFLSLIVALMMLATMFTLTVSADSTSATLALSKYEITSKGLRLMFNEDLTAITADITDLKGNAIATTETFSGKTANVVLATAMNIESPYVLTFTATSASGTLEGSKKITFEVVLNEDFESYSSVNDLGTNDYYKLLVPTSNSIVPISNYSSWMDLVKDENNNTWFKITGDATNRIFLLRPIAGAKNITVEFDVKGVGSTDETPILPGFLVYTFHNSVRYWGGKYILQGNATNFLAETISSGPLYQFERKKQNVETFAVVREMDGNKEYGRFYEAGYYNGAFAGEYSADSNPELQTIYYQGYYIGALDKTGVLYDNYKVYTASMIDYKYVPFSLDYENILRDGIYLTYTADLDTTSTPVVTLAQNGTPVATTVSVSGKNVIVKPQAGKLDVNKAYSVSVTGIKSKDDGVEATYEKEFGLQQYFYDDFEGYFNEDGSYNGEKFLSTYAFAEAAATDAATKIAKYYPEAVDGDTALRLVTGCNAWLTIDAAKYGLPNDYVLEFDQKAISPYGGGARDCGPRIVFAADGIWTADTPATGKSIEFVYSPAGRAVLYGGIFGKGSQTRFVSSVVAANPVFITSTFVKQPYDGAEGNTVFSYFENGGNVFDLKGNWHQNAFRAYFRGYYSQAYIDNLRAYKAVDLSETPAPEFVSAEITRGAVKLNYSQAIPNGTFVLTQGGNLVSTTVSKTNGGKTVVLTPANKLTLDLNYEISATGVSDDFGRAAANVNKAFRLDTLFADNFDSYTEAADLDKYYNVSSSAAKIVKKPVSEFNEEAGYEIYGVKDGRLTINTTPNVSNAKLNLASINLPNWNAYTLEMDLERSGDKWQLDVSYAMPRTANYSADDYTNWIRMGLYDGDDATIKFNNGVSERGLTNAFTQKNVNLVITSATGKDISIYNNGTSIFSFTGTTELLAGEFGFKMWGNETSVTENNYYVDNLLAYKTVWLDKTAKNVFVSSAVKGEDKLTGTWVLADYAEAGTRAGDVIVAAYNRNGTLAGVDIIPVSKVFSTSGNFEISCNTENVTNVKVYLWNTNGGITLQAEAVAGYDVVE